VSSLTRVPTEKAPCADSILGPTQPALMAPATQTLDEATPRARGDHPRWSPSLLALALTVLGVALAVAGCGEDTAAESVAAPAQRPIHQSWRCGWGSFRDRASFQLPPACWRPFADRSWLNTPLPAHPRLAVRGVHGENAGSADLVRALMNHGTGAVGDLRPVGAQSWQHAMYFNRPSDPVYTLSCAHSTRNCNQKNSAAGKRLRIPCNATVPNGTDRQLFVIDQRTGYEWDMTGLNRAQVLCGGGTFYVTLATKIRMSGDGRGSCAADAACVGMSAGQVREPELASGSISHALFMVNGECNSSGTPASLYPADPHNTCSDSSRGAPKVGQWFYLAMTDSQIAASGFAPWQRTILRALAHYGMFVGDQGSNGAFDVFTEDQSTWSSFGQPNPWLSLARRLAKDPANHVESADPASVVLGMSNIPHSFWTTHLRAVDPCVVRRTCSP
jgi:hypothetical protein